MVGPTRGAAAGPRWRRSSPGLYVPAAVLTSVEQGVHEQARRLPTDGALGGWAALRVRGAAYVDDADPRVPLVVARPANLRPSPDHRLVRVRDMPPVEHVHGLPCVEAVAALLDVVRQQPDLRRRVVAIDMALAAGVVSQEQLESARRSRGAAALREALPLVDGRSRSPLESWLRLVWVLDARLPVPLSNWPLFTLDDFPLGRPDLVCDELGVCVEYDGSAHAGAFRRRTDALRRDGFRDAGLEVVTVVGGGWGRECAVVRQLLAARDRSLAWTRPRGWRLGVPHDGPRLA
ncbi:hypothetical protein [Nocardioides marmoraquaticus]